MPFTYRFTFRSNQSSLVFGANQVANWDKMKVKLSKNKDYRGVFFEYTDTFEFIDEARLFIRDLAYSEGLDAFLELKIEQGNESGHDSSFVAFDTLIAEFNDSYQMKETSCNVSFIESGVKQKITNRADSNVDYRTYTSVDGDTITPYENETLSTYMHDREVRLNALASGVLESFDAVVDYDYYAISGANIQYSADEDAQNVILYDGRKSGIPIESYLLLRANQDKTVNLSISGFVGILNVFDLVSHKTHTIL